MKKIVITLVLFLTFLLFNPLDVCATGISKMEFNYYIVNVSSIDDEEVMEVKETFKLSANPNNYKLRRYIFHNELMYDFDTNIENYKKNGISYYDFDVELDKDYYISYKIKSTDVKEKEVKGHVAQFYFKTYYAGTKSSKEFTIPNLRLIFNVSDKINKNKIQIYGGEVYRATDEYTSIVVTPTNKENVEENYMYTYFVYSAFPEIKISDYKVIIRYKIEEKKFEINETFKVEAEGGSKEYTKDLEKDYLFESKNCKLKFEQNPDGTYGYKFTNSGTFKCSMIYEVEESRSEMEEIYFAPFMLKPAIKYDLIYKDYYLQFNLDDLKDYSFDIEGCPNCRINKTSSSIVLTTYGSVDSIPGVYIKKGNKSIGDISSIFTKDFFKNIMVKAVIAFVIFLVVSILIVIFDKQDKSKKKIRIVTIILSLIVYIGFSVNAILSALLIPIFYSYFFYNQFYVPRKNTILDLVFVIGHPLIFTGSIVSPLAYGILIYTLIKVANFYKRNTAKK